MIIQSTYRGMIGRRLFHQRKDKLEIRREIQIAKQVVNQLILENKIHESCEILCKVRKPTIEILVVHAKLLYSIDKFEDCERIARHIIGTYILL